MAQSSFENLAHCLQPPARVDSWVDLHALEKGQKEGRAEHPAEGVVIHLGAVAFVTSQRALLWSNLAFCHLNGFVGLLPKSESDTLFWWVGDTDGGTFILKLPYVGDSLFFSSRLLFDMFPLYSFKPSSAFRTLTVSAPPPCQLHPLC